MTALAAAVDVATVWTAPTAPRPVDEAAVADVPDPAAWLRALDGRARLGLHGRTLTQLLRGEPVELLEQGRNGWVKVAAKWQPCPEDSRGHPGWVRSAHVRRVPPADMAGQPPGDAAWPPEGASLLASARHHVGVQYLWGGTSPWGFDCSGLVHYCHRMAGVVVPRDASAQQRAAHPVALGTERPGDLYFFGGDGGIDHVGLVTGDGRMLHAPESPGGQPAGTGRIEEAPLARERHESLVCAGTFLAFPNDRDDRPRESRSAAPPDTTSGAGEVIASRALARGPTRGGDRCAGPAQSG